MYIFFMFIYGFLKKVGDLIDIILNPHITSSKQ